MDSWKGPLEPTPMHAAEESKTKTKKGFCKRWDPISSSGGRNTLCGGWVHPHAGPPTRQWKKEVIFRTWGSHF